MISNDEGLEREEFKLDSKDVGYGFADVLWIVNPLSYFDELVYFFLGKHVIPNLLTLFVSWAKHVIYK